MSVKLKIFLLLLVLAALIYISAVPYKFLIGTEPFKYITIYLLITLILLPLTSLLSTLQLRGLTTGNWKRALRIAIIASASLVLLILLLYCVFILLYANSFVTTGINVLIEFLFALAWMSVIFYMYSRVQAAVVNKLWKIPPAESQRIFLLANLPSCIIAALPYGAVVLSVFYEILG